MILLTKTMLSKACIDANKAVQEFAKDIGESYEPMSAGEKTIIKAKWSATGKDTEIRFYRTAGVRADKRVSIKDIKQNAEAGDTIKFRITKAGTILVDVLS